MDHGAEEGTSVGAQVAVWCRGRTATLARGLAAPGRPMTDATLLPWFSLTKVLVGVALVQQWERGRLDPDDAVAAHLPDFAAHGKEGVTLRHLLTHTARLDAAPEEDAGWAALVEAACGSSLPDGWQPGRRAAYSPRLAYSVLGEVVRRADGRPLDAYVSEEVFEPLGMADSWLALPPERYEAYGDRMGVMHDTKGEAAPIPAFSGPAAFAEARPSGSAVGPAGDLVRLFVALLHKGELDGMRVLTPQGADAMCARHRSGMKDEAFGEYLDWGLGVIVNSWHYKRRPAPYGFGDHASPRTFGHGGNQSSVAFADPDAGLAAAVVFNGMAGEARHHRRTQRVVNAIYRDLGLAG